MALAIALVLERFFADLTSQQEAQTDSPPPATSTQAFPLEQLPPASEQAPPPAASAPPPPDAPGEPPPDAPQPQWQYRLGPTLGVAVSEVASDGRPEIGAVAQAVTPRHIAFGLMGTGSWQARSEVEWINGQKIELRSQTQTLRGFSRYWLDNDRWWLGIGPELVLGLEWASERKPSDTRNKGRALPGLGLGAEFAFRLNHVLAIGVASSADLMWADGVAKFTYSWVAPDGTELTTEVLKPRRFGGFFGVTLEFAPDE
jgi:hypothetical protein